MVKNIQALFLSLFASRARLAWVIAAVMAMVAGVWAWEQNTHTQPKNIPLQIPSSQTAAADAESPQQPVTASVSVPPVADATTQTDSSEEPEWQNMKVQPGDTLSRLLNRHKLPTQDLRDLQKSKQASLLTKLYAGQTLHYQRTADGHLQSLVVPLADQRTVTAQREGKGYLIALQTPELEKQLAYSSSTIQDSLFVSGKKAGLTPHLISQMVDILGYDIDFAMDIHPNDKFHVLFEEKYLKGKRVGTGNILAVEFVNRGKKVQAVRYTNSKGHVGYFSPEGKGVHKSFLRTPVQFTRISSHFGQRKHPVLHKMRVHKGVDYAAPVGTPIKAVGDAKVLFAGTKGGYGKAIELQHTASHTTFYAHLSKISQNIRPGTPVKQGQVIGYVGKTGLASGPHLHYEFRVNGVHHNPLTVALPKTQAIPESHKKDFKSHAQKLMALLNSHKTIAVAKNEYYTPRILQE